MYKIIVMGELKNIYHADKGVIPEDEMNVDYLEYVAWLFEGNTPTEWIPETGEEN